MRGMILAAAAVSALAFGGTADASGAQRHKHHRAHHHHARPHKQQPAPQPQPVPPRTPKPAAFDGSCDFTGAVKFDPPMTTTPQHVAQHADAPGTCSGTFVDRFGGTHKLDNAPARYRADSAGDNVSCAFGLASGSGELVFPDGEIAFAMNEYRLTATPMIRLTGSAGGGAWMPVTPAPSSDPAAAVEACNGAGLSEFDLTAHLQTDSTMRG